ncbi:mechanosensitive ion channel family protein [Cupriavidus taiwanensis]|uniref:mechanosensitive ion channel family protein n=1 Tax=Cupriavidus taiwanensis TaxID=164546 RepID=UPI000E139F29|nr:mechanosensitive ion channel family protein [Cupriavidus taiwanensis]SOZ30693.1 putative MscS Mechanosensitive ion channel [Cupriavidus taiwanensis]SPA35364.1 putative MscS Mechanosensitive ion channel [Cupriavidus taiwanensis]
MRKPEPHAFARRRRHAVLGTALALLAGLLALLCALPARAAPADQLAALLAPAEKPVAPASAAAASVPLAQSLDQVIATLQDDGERRALLSQLQTLRQGLAASAAVAAPAAASTPGLIGTMAQVLDEVDSHLREDRGPWQYWGWRTRFAAEEWRAALTQNGTRTGLDSLREFALVLAAWGVCGWLLREAGHRLRRRRAADAPRAPRGKLPELPSWVDVGIYMLRHIGPWVVAFGLTLLLARQLFAQSPASVAAVLLAYAIVAGAVAAAVCQVIFALFRSAHRQLAVRQLLARSPWLLFCTGALAALGNGAADARMAALLGSNLSALVSTLANIAAALGIGVFALGFRRQIGQLISQRPLAFRQAHPAVTDLLRLAGNAWHLPVLAVVVASVIGTVLATGHADVFLRRTVASVALFVAALLLTMVLGRSPKAGARAPRIRDRRRSAYLQRFGRFALALVRVLVWAGFVEMVMRVWGSSLVRLAESSAIGRHLTETALRVTSTVLLAWLVWLLIDTAIMQSLSPTHARAAQPSLRARTILPLVRNASFIGLLVLTVIVVLANLGVNVTPLLAGAGVVGLAIGFGAQSLVQDLITGLFIVIEDSIAIGDSIELPDHAGVVEAMTIRTVKLRDGRGALHTLPYSQIKAVKNLSRGYGYAVLSIGISYQSDLDRALELIRATGAELAHDLRYGRKLMSGLEILGLDRFDPSGPVVLAQIKTRPLMQAEITRAFNARLKRNFDASGIRMASPNLTIQVDGGTVELPAGELAAKAAPQ